MPRISKPKPTPQIDMTPMVDLAFLLVTFFMLSANFRKDELVVIDIPYSISEELMPKEYMQIDVSKDGKVFIGFTGNEELKKNVLAELFQKANIPASELTQARVNTFNATPEFGTPLRSLPKYLDLSPDERKKLAEAGEPNAIPTDSTRNELKVWVRIIYDQMNQDGKERFEKMVSENPGMDKKQLAQDMKPKFILHADKDTPYHFVQNVVETFKEMDLDTKFSFVTSMMADPRKTTEK